MRPLTPALWATLQQIAREEGVLYLFEVQLAIVRELGIRGLIKLDEDHNFWLTDEGRRVLAERSAKTDGGMTP
jgi:hypothetical protein